MKKIFLRAPARVITVCAFAAFITLAVPAAAQETAWTDLFRLSAWGRGVITPYAFSDGDSSVSAATYTGGDKPNIGFTVAGHNPGHTIGFETDIQWDGSTIGIGDDAKVWVKPAPFIKLTAGAFKEDDFRGKISNTEFTSWILPNGGLAEDAIFQRFDASMGAHFRIDPLYWLDPSGNGLIIEGAFGSNVQATGAGSGDGRANRNIIGMDASDVFGAMQLAAAYKMPDVFLARLQFTGNNRKQLRQNWQRAGAPLEGQDIMSGLNKYGALRDADVIEGAFEFTGVKGLNLDAGVKIPLEYTTDVGFTEYQALYPNPPVLTVDGDTRKVQKPMSVAIAAVYEPPALGSRLRVLCRADVSFGGEIEEENDHRITFGTTINAWLNASYLIAPLIRLGVDTGFETHAKDGWQQPIGIPNNEKVEGSDYTDFGFGPWCELVLGKGSFKAGLMVMLPGSARWTFISSNTTGYEYKQVFSGEPVISLPLSFTYNL